MSGTTVKRALVSVFDKDGVVDLCRALEKMDVEIVSTGGTARLLESSGVRVRRVSDVTGFPEMLDGRVKTVHPAIHGGILAVRSDPRHLADLARTGIQPIDLVVVNFYAFESAARKEGATLDETIEMIDIGGPAMVRAAAKNHAHVAVVVDPSDYGPILAEMREGGSIGEETRRSLAEKAFRRTSEYDDAVASYLARAAEGGGDAAAGVPTALTLPLVKALDLVYGENPHQAAAFYRDSGSRARTLLEASQLQGKPLSFNNILDFDGALALASDLGRDACVIVKHGNPCGVAVAADPSAAFRKALECDPVSAFGGIIAFTNEVDAAAAAAVAEAFYEGLAAPDFTPEARTVLARRTKLRIFRMGPLPSFRQEGFDVRRSAGGYLVQEWDTAPDPVRESKVATLRRPTEEEWLALELAWRVCRHVKSNAIVYAAADRTLGIGAGQMSRVDSARFAIEKARGPLRGAAMASDAFFPFRDGLDLAAEAGITAVIQPGGSIRDEEVVAAADQHDIAMVFAGRRHFRH
jgi:phosphoribosylaminoimidazolecarboxamide formyltransferase/IMP cyclohydrolase